MGGTGNSTLWGSTVPGGVPGAGTNGPTLASDLIYMALRAAGVVKRAASGPSQSEYSDGLKLLNRLIDQWAARRVFAYNVDFSAYTLTPNHQPHLVGPGLVSPDFDATRPVRIEAAALVLNTSTPNVDIPLNLRDDDWWASQRVKGLSTNVPTDLYYSPSHPNGSLYLWPVPSFAYGLRLEAWKVLTQCQDIATQIILPPGYEDALVWTLAERLCPVFGHPVTPEVREEARRARVAVLANNVKSPRTESADYGTRGRSRGDFNYYTGGPR